ncbi:hypothetical protein OZ411_01305 [Bradyrhizobium sp. Arg237L]|uniref:hypothetical protein n=1 Tax=Bradyrhizobium sp. Arg237L TaxID=3003352 RepID=UPI00249EADC5|nr:hypothetical protein [Bradyrhizobium sp. Arg237L]MDI4231450.1 hypothetical protein [Bradyrhizobium sp. Arg237L]
MVTVSYWFFSMRALAEFALQTLRDLSPVGSGDDPHIGLYRASHLLFLNGQVVEDASAWKPGDQLGISNPVPYARLIEVGILRMRVSGTDRVYQQAETIIRSRYGNVIDVKFTYMPVRFTSASAATTFRRIEGKDADTRASSLKEQPALLITQRFAA